jgi:hypothetical protein
MFLVRDEKVFAGLVLVLIPDEVGDLFILGLLDSILIALVALFEHILLDPVDG